MQVLQILTDGAVPSPDLISSIKSLYSKTKVEGHCLPEYKVLIDTYQIGVHSDILSSNLSASLCRILRSFLQFWLIC
jgi:hypothetical protein